MLLANWLQVHDASAFLDAFAEAAGTMRGWKQESIKFDYGYQFVYVRYTGRKFAGKGLMASAFAPIPSVPSASPIRVHLRSSAAGWPILRFLQCGAMILRGFLRMLERPGNR